MTLNWYVAVAEHRRDELAYCTLSAAGFETVLPRTWQREKMMSGKWKIVPTPSLSPYLFFRSDGSNEEHAVAKRQRGVLCVLTDSRGRPSPIPTVVIDSNTVRELEEQAGLQPKPKSKMRADLILNSSYTIIRHKLFEGYVGKLLGVSNGMAHLDVDKRHIALPDCDIKLIPVPVQAKKGAA